MQIRGSKPIHVEYVMLRRKGPNFRSSEVGFAGTLFLTSLELFCCLNDNISEGCDSSPRDATTLREQLESYLLWGNHYQPASGSLDHVVVALSKELRDAVLSYIGNISQTLCKRMLSPFFYKSECCKLIRRPLGLFALLDRSENEWPQRHQANDHCTEITHLLDGLEDRGVVLDKSALDDDSIEYVVEDLRSSIDLLHEMVPALDDIAIELETPVLTDTYSMSEDNLNLSGPASHYYRKIVDRFPLLTTTLAKRLAQASWRRHNRVRGALEKRKIAITSELMTEFHDSGLGTTLKTASTYAASQASYQSFMSSRADIEGAHARLPEMPSEISSGRPFVCDLCGLEVKDVKNKLQWRHVSSLSW